MSDDIDDVTLEPLSDDGESEAGTPEQKLKQLRDKLRKAEAEANDNLAGWQRAKADYINLQKRMRDIEGTLSKAGVAAVIVGLVDVFDSIEASGHPAILKQLDASLGRLGVTRSSPKVGDAFNPELHEPVSAVATSSNVEDNTIHSVLQSGYSLEGVTLRPARVSVFHLSSL